MSDFRPKTVILSSSRDDTPTLHTGLLIPQSVLTRQANGHPRWHHAMRLGSLALLAVCVGLLAELGLSGLERNSQRATPLVTIYDTKQDIRTPLPWGSHGALMQASFFTETRDSFIEQSISFIEVDLVAMQLRYFEGGVLRLSVPIVNKGTAGSWWETPAGIYETTGKQTEQFATVAQTILPWSIAFATNYAIHGAPLYPDGRTVEMDRAEGGIQLKTSDAVQLFELVALGTPVLVHDRPEVARPLVYDAPLVGVTAAAYLVADRETGTVLSGQAVNDVLPIASITKLMTALIVAEELDLDARVRVTETNFVASLIPRLADRSSVSVYSLLQLLLVESSNEAAEVLAAQMPAEAMVAAMNKKAQALGMSHTLFVDTSGLSAGNQSTAYDLFLLMRHIREQRSFILDLTSRAAVRTAYTAGEFGPLVNFNTSTSTSSFRGGKVGETLAARQTSVSLHEFPARTATREVVIVVLGTDERTKDIDRLIEFTTERLR